MSEFARAYAEALSLMIDLLGPIAWIGLILYTVLFLTERYRK